MKKQWSYFTNPFLAVTDGSYLKAFNISTYHDTALQGVQADPFFGPLYTAYHPLHLAFKTAYANWVTQAGAQTGKTLNLKQLLSLLSNTKIKQWDVAIQVVSPQGTPAYQALLPNNRVPFQQGQQLERINAVKSLSNALIGIVALASTKTDVDAFYTLLDAANNAQKTSKSTTHLRSDGVESARLTVCDAQFANLGAMIQKYYTTPNIIADYFDMESIRASNQTHFEGHLKPLHLHTVCKHTFILTDSIELINKSTTPLSIYLAQSKDAPMGGPVVSVPPTTSSVILLSALGDLTNTHLIITNPDVAITAEWVIDLV